MSKNIISKSIGLLLAYIVIIVGIFIFQFRSDLIISEKIGNLQISLAETRNEDGSVSLKDKMKISFNGVTFFSDEVNAATVDMKDITEQKKLSLVSWEKPSSLSAKFNFTDGVSIVFTTRDTKSETEYLSVNAYIPENILNLYLPYELISTSSIVTQTNTYLQLSIRNRHWEMSAADIKNNFIAFTQEVNTASYAYYDATKKFSFENTQSFAKANEELYNSTITTFTQNLINAFAPRQEVTEQQVVSFVAAMAERGRYNEALDIVPSSFKKGVQRSYISSPYFDSLATMNRSLELQMASYRDIIAQNTIDAFSVKGIVDYMCMYPTSNAVRAILNTASNIDVNTINISQATSILSAYNFLLGKNSELASIIQGVAQVCVNKISDACTIDGESITISENGTFVSVIQGSEIGDALIRYGKATGMGAIEKCGYLIINSYLSDSASFDLRTLSELYPIVVRDNPFYPHFAMLGFDNGEAVWAWTCAKNMMFEKDGRGNITLKIDFPQTYTHYVIINGIKKFQQIYIYDMAFRTDPRFETYNSSGYVFRNNTNTLLLKSRHKSQIETIRLVYSVAASNNETRKITETDEKGNVITQPPEQNVSPDALPEGNIPMSTDNTIPEVAE